MTTETKWINPQGRTIPDSMVTPADRMKDELTRRLADAADELQAQIIAFKFTALTELEAAKALLFEQYGVKVGGAKGGFSIRSFDGSTEAEVSVADRIVFGAELQAAKALIDECIEDWTRNGNDNVRILVEDAFQVNKAGRIDTQRVLGLRKHKMKVPGTDQLDQRWIRAMDAVTDAMIVDRTATYVRFYRRDPKTNKREQIVLDFSAL